MKKHKTETSDTQSYLDEGIRLLRKDWESFSGPSNSFSSGFQEAAEELSAPLYPYRRLAFLQGALALLLFLNLFQLFYMRNRFGQDERFTATALEEELQVDSYADIGARETGYVLAPDDTRARQVLDIVEFTEGVERFMGFYEIKELAPSFLNRKELTNVGM